MLGNNRHVRLTTKNPEFNSKIMDSIGEYIYIFFLFRQFSYRFIMITFIF